MVKTLSANATENVFTFQYVWVTTGTLPGGDVSLPDNEIPLDQQNLENLEERQTINQRIVKNKICGKSLLSCSCMGVSFFDGEIGRSCLAVAGDEKNRERIWCRIIYSNLNT